MYSSSNDRVSADGIMQSCLMAWEAHERCDHYAVTLSIGAQPQTVCVLAGGAARGAL